MNVTSRISGCLLAVLSLAGAAFAQNGVLPTVPLNTPSVALTHSLNGNPYGLDTYNANTEVFSVSGVATSITFPPAKGFCTSSCPAPLLSVTIQVDNTGKLIGGNPNSSQPDLVLNGQITNGTTTYTSPLLTGQITEFYFDGVNDTPNFAFRIAVTGGSMASLYLNSPSTNNDLWLTLTLENQTGYTNFTGSFAANFGGVTKANINSTPGKCYGKIGDFVWNDLN